MQRTLTIALSTLLTAFLAVPAAHALDGWLFGAAFEVGGVHFEIGLHDDHHYYRTPVELGRHYYGRSHRYAHGHHGDRCHRRGGYYYHTASCPLIHAYFRDHGHRVFHFVERYGPRHRGHHYRRHGHHDRYRHREYHRKHHHYDRHHRRDHRYDRGRVDRRDHRYDRRHHRRDHRFDRGRHDRRDHRDDRRHHRRSRRGHR